MTLRPKDYDSNGDIIPSSWKEEKGDLISRKWLTDAIRNRKTYLSYEDAKDVIDLIDNAPAVEAFTEEYVSGAYNEGYMCGSREAEKARPQGEWICITKSTFPQYQPDEYKCSQCNKLCHIKYYFCPFCGAQMIGGDNND